MRYIRILLTMICLVLLLSSCGKKSDAVLIVKEDDVSIEGRVTFVAEGAGFRPNAWAPGNIVIFALITQLQVNPGKQVWSISSMRIINSKTSAKLI